VTWPIDMRDVLAARQRIAPWLRPTPFRRYETLESELGHGLQVRVKHDNHQPTGSFKARNGLSALTSLNAAERARGIVAATRGNHGLGLAFAGRELGVPVAICVPRGNNPEKNAAMRALGADLREDGRDYDEALAISKALVEEEGRTLIHSTNCAPVIAGAATMTLEMIEEWPEMDALVLAVGGGSQIVGAMTVLRALAPQVKVYGVQAARASATHDSWHAGEARTTESALTFADGLATRSSYAMTLPAMREGLSGFVACEEEEIAEAVRLFMRHTHNVAEGAGACGLAGLVRLREELAGQRVGVVLCGGNIDQATLAWIFGGQPYPLAESAS
jgi:threonine dehydratase